MQFENGGKSLKTRVNHFIHTPVWRALSQSDCSISSVNQQYPIGVIEWAIFAVINSFLLQVPTDLKPCREYALIKDCCKRMYWI